MLFRSEVEADRGEQLRQEADLFTAHNQLGPASGQEEAFGVSIIEAMAAGLPVVSGRSGSLEEVIGDEAGILVEPGDVAAHGRALVRLASSPQLRQTMGAAGWRRCRERFTIERESTQLRQILLSAGGAAASSGSYPAGRNAQFPGCGEPRGS